MRMLLKVSFPHEPFNSLVRDGTVEKRLQAIIDDLDPDALFFTEFDGKRGMVMVLDIIEASQIPAMAEPLFLTFDADVEMHPAMTRDDLGKAGLVNLGKKWS